MEDTTTEAVTTIAEVGAATAQVGPDATPPVAPAEEPTPDTELAVRDTIPHRALDLLEKFRRDYPGVKVDLATPPADVWTGRLDQLPSNMHNRLGAAAAELRHFAEGMIAKLGATDHSLLVSPCLNPSVGAC